MTNFALATLRCIYLYMYIGFAYTCTCAHVIGH